MKKVYINDYTQNREISWLRFNERVLQEAEDKNVRSYEKLKFVSIYVSNLDEFFMIRVGSLLDMRFTDDSEKDNKSGLRPSEQINIICKLVGRLYMEKDEIHESVEKELRDKGVICLRANELNKGELKFIEKYFLMNIEPVISPLILSSKHPFPHLENNTIYNIGKMKVDNNDEFGLLPNPSQLPEYIIIPDDINEDGTFRYILMEEILQMYMDKIFSPFQINEKAVIYITRNADIKLDEETSDLSEDYRKKMMELLKKRTKLAPDRLLVNKKLSSSFASFLLKNLQLNKKQLFITETQMSMGYVYALEKELPEKMKEKLCDAKYKPFVQNKIKQRKILDIVKKHDILSSYPYESMDLILQLLKESALDKNVEEIRITIYRLARNAKIVDYLSLAALNGKKVKVQIELRARFDEQNNIDWSEKLEEAGCYVFYGIEDYKVHSKLCQIVRNDGNGKKYITQIATGNYNEKTAELYVDLSLITYDQKIGKDASVFFNNMLKGNLNGHYKRLLVAPSEMKKRILYMIDHEIEKGSKGRVFIKVNSITDIDIIEKLSEASCAGVKVRMIVRGICCILPGVKGYTENVEVVNIIGRYLEHSRIYIFGYGKNEKMYISSADFMTRNTVRRVELACPVYDKKIRDKIKHILYLNYNDNVKGRIMNSKGKYKKKESQNKYRLNSQAELMKEASRTQSI